MKLIYCKKCNDLVKLSLEIRTCECGDVQGRYINNVEAEVSENAVSVAIGNGSLRQAIQNMELFSERHGEELSRESYQNLAPIQFAWVRPNEGKGNPHTTVMKKTSRIVELQYVDTRLIEQTNTKLDEKTVQAIVDEGIDPERLSALPAWNNGGKWILTDGNHRLEALKIIGEVYAPIAELTKAEFDHVKFSKRKVDLLVKIPDNPKYHTAK